MYKEYFGLKEPPFSIAPDPHYLYMSDNHREALAHLLYGINSDNGFVLLTGDVGTGKTTVCRCLLAQLPENSNIAFILNPKVTVDELLATICDELGIGYPSGNISNKVFIDSINDYLINANKNGGRTVLIVEEAQNLSPHQIKTIITRTGEGTKMIFTGDLGQIDDKTRIDKHSSGLAFAQTTMSNNSMVAVMNFQETVRGKLAQLAEERMKLAA